MRYLYVFLSSSKNEIAGMQYQIVTFVDFFL